jgi:acyl-CoA thioester hydrolase
LARPKPETRDRYPHFLGIRTRWMDNDACGPVNSAGYYACFDTVLNQFLIARGVPDITTSPVAFPDAVHAGSRAALEKIPGPAGG